MNSKERVSVCPLGQKYQKYWDLLSPAERRMRFDKYGLMAITPRCFAEPILQRIQGETVLDACCSVGGMAIALAAHRKQVIAVELDRDRLDLANQNAAIFGVSDRIRFIHGDVLDVMPRVACDTIFFDGQWSDVAGADGTTFRLSDFSPNGETFLTSCFAQTDSVVLRTPANFDLRDLDHFDRRFEYEPTVVEGLTVAYTIYFGHQTPA